MHNCSRFISSRAHLVHIQVLAILNYQRVNYFSGAHGRNRTYDLLLRRQTLYPLSYVGNNTKTTLCFWSLFVTYFALNTHHFHIAFFLEIISEIVAFSVISVTPRGYLLNIRS